MLKMRGKQILRIDKFRWRPMAECPARRHGPHKQGVGTRCAWDLLMLVGNRLLLRMMQNTIDCTGQKRVRLIYSWNSGCLNCTEVLGLKKWKDWEILRDTRNWGNIRSLNRQLANGRYLSFREYWRNCVTASQSPDRSALQSKQTDRFRAWQRNWKKMSKWTGNQWNG